MAGAGTVTTSGMNGANTMTGAATAAEITGKAGAVSAS
jgi:hypothetical protein